MIIDALYTLFILAVSFLTVGMAVVLLVKFFTSKNSIDFGCKEDFSSRYEYDEKDPWSMFREHK